MNIIFSYILLLTKKSQGCVQVLSVGSKYVRNTLSYSNVVGIKPYLIKVRAKVRVKVRDF